MVAFNRYQCAVCRRLYPTAYERSAGPGLVVLILLQLREFEIRFKPQSTFLRYQILINRHMEVRSLNAMEAWIKGKQPAERLQDCFLSGAIWAYKVTSSNVITVGPLLKD